ncbi:MAG: class I SAM-dependent methyltransferase [Gemmataceae bacterium]
MFDPTGRDPTGRFSGLAATYESHRPDYPAAAIDFILEHCGLRPGRRLVDVGCGTGISSRQFAARGLEVVGIEPNTDMRRTAEVVGGPMSYRDGRADATGLCDACANAVLAAQAFHWFAADAALAEFHRILKPGGWVVLMWNERDTADVFTARFIALLATHSPDPQLATLVQSKTGDVLLNCPLFKDAQRRELPHQQPLTADKFIGRAFSASYSPRDAESRRRLEANLRQLHAQHAAGGVAALQYRTTLFLARRPLVAGAADCYARG